MQSVSSAAAFLLFSHTAAGMVRFTAAPSPRWLMSLALWLCCQRRARAGLQARTTLAARAAALTPDKGVTLELNISYLEAAKLGDTVHVDAEVVKIGRSTALLSATIRSEASGRLVAVGRHTKFLLGLGGTSTEALLEQARTLPPLQSKL